MICKAIKKWWNKEKPTGKVSFEIPVIDVENLHKDNFSDFELDVMEIIND